MKYRVAAAALVLFVNASFGAQKPNVLFIAVDDLNDWVNCLDGYAGTVCTPNIDRLAKQGVLFTSAHCSDPLCNPSRAALMTGVRSSDSGVYRLDQCFRDSEVLKDAVTIPQYFRQFGYETLAAGKVFHGWDSVGPWSCWSDSQSWDQQRARPPFVEPPQKPNHPIAGFQGIMDYCALDVADEEMSDSKNIQWCIDRLQEDRDRPFFLAAGVFRPHIPLYVSKKYFDLYPLDQIVVPEVDPDDWNDLPPVAKQFAAYGCFAGPAPQSRTAYDELKQTGQDKKFIQAYLASITFADACIGRLLDALDNSRYADQTVIVLWSDNGWHLGEKMHWEKFTLWQESTRIVLAISAPGFSKNKRCDQSVSLMDLYPTLVDLCGLPEKKDIEGHSLVPLLSDPQEEWPWPAVTTFMKDNHSVRYKTWRYTRYHDGSEELYDLSVDPEEWTNLAGKEQYGAVKEKLAHWLPTGNAEQIPAWKRSE
jgi:arylsulfatase A-like enzyme